MAVDENGNEIIQTTPAPVINPAQERITDLSDKLRIASEGKESADAKANEAERRAAFAEGFVDVITAQPAAKDHKDEIRDKVLKGYSVQDATFAILGPLGKINGNAPVFTPQVAGGSADTTITQNTQKEVKDMTQPERRAQLEKDLLWQ